MADSGSTAKAAIRHSNPARNNPPKNIPAEDDIYDSSKQPWVITKLFLHSIAMFTLPFVAYFYTRDYVTEQLDMTFQQGYIFGCVAAVITVNLIIASYIYQAFAEESNSSSKLKPVMVKKD